MLIPESYVPDPDGALIPISRIANLADAEAVSGFAAELKDRFGPVPAEVINLVEVVELKQLCRQLNIAKIDAGGKGFALSFRNNEFEKPEALVGWIAGKAGQVLLKADQRLIIKSELGKIGTRARIAKTMLHELAAL